MVLENEVIDYLSIRPFNTDMFSFTFDEIEGHQLNVYDWFLHVFFMFQHSNLSMVAKSSHMNPLQGKRG